MMKKQIQAIILLLASHAYSVDGAKNVRGGGGIPPAAEESSMKVQVKRMLWGPRNYAIDSPFVDGRGIGGGSKELTPHASKIRGAISTDDGPMTDEMTRILLGRPDDPKDYYALLGDEEDARVPEETFAEIVRLLQQEDSCDDADCAVGAACDDSFNCACKSPYVPNPKKTKVPVQALPYIKNGCVLPASVEVDNLVPGHCGIYNQTCVRGALCQEVDEKDDQKRLKCFCNGNEGWVGDPEFLSHRDIANIKKWNLFGFYSCVDLDECLDPKNNECASADQCEDRDPGPLVTDRYACFCKAGFVASDFGPRGPRTCTDIDECATLDDPCPTGQFCENTPGSYKCWCDKDKLKEPDPNGFCPIGEINESGCGSTKEKCTSIGQYCIKETIPNAPDKENCLCMEGWIQPAGERAQCQDRDECALSLDFKCDRRSDKSGRYSKCINVDKSNEDVSTLGWDDGYRCECSPGFTDTPNTPKGTKCIPPEAPVLPPAENIEVSTSAPTTAPAPAPAPGPVNKCFLSAPGSPAKSLDVACREQEGRFCDQTTQKCACLAPLYTVTEITDPSLGVNCQKNQCLDNGGPCGANTECTDIEDPAIGDGFRCDCDTGFIREILAINPETLTDLQDGGNCVQCNTLGTSGCTGTDVCLQVGGVNTCVANCVDGQNQCEPENLSCVQNGFGDWFCGECDANHACAVGICFQNKCGLCFNSDETDTVADNGCSEAQKFCVDAGFKSPNAKAVGTQCSSCIDSGIGDQVDAGCEADTPLCTFVEGVGACVGCINDETGSATDTGCSNIAPYCLADAGKTGSCVAGCINDKNDASTDTGCSGPTTICNAAFARGWYMCFCINDHTGLLTDTGCDGNTPFVS
jgi:hypothetical protein